MTLEQQVHQNDVKLKKAEEAIKQLETNLKVLVSFINDNGLSFDKIQTNKLKSKGFLNDK